MLLRNELPSGPLGSAAKKRRRALPARQATFTYTIRLKYSTLYALLEQQEPAAPQEPAEQPRVEVKPPVNKRRKLLLPPAPLAKELAAAAKSGTAKEKIPGSKQQKAISDALVYPKPGMQHLSSPVLAETEGCNAQKEGQQKEQIASTAGNLTSIKLGISVWIAEAKQSAASPNSSAVPREERDGKRDATAALSSTDMKQLAAPELQSLPEVHPQAPCDSSIRAPLPSFAALLGMSLSAPLQKHINAFLLSQR